MTEYRNPNLESKNPRNNGDDFARLAFIIVFSLIALGTHHLWQTQHPVQLSPNHVNLVPVPKHALTTAHISEVSSSSNGFGWLTFIAVPLYTALRLVQDHGIGNWGWSIVFLTVVFNLLIIWPRMASMKSSLKMMRLQPKLELIRKRYAHLKTGDPKRAEMNKELMDLYNTEGANVFGGCLPLILQMPLLFAFMSVLRSAVQLHQAKWLWLPDLASPDPLHILPILIMVTMALTQSLTPASGFNRSQKWVLATLTPAVMGVSLWRYASGMSLYWVTGNIFSMIAQIAVKRYR